jgi:hypothetical protein
MQKHKVRMPGVGQRERLCNPPVLLGGLDRMASGPALMGKKNKIPFLWIFVFALGGPEWCRYSGIAGRPGRQA